MVDNNSQASKTHRDATAAVALHLGAKVVREPEQGISRARNTGASHAEGDVLVFVDADVIIPPTLLEVIHSVMSGPRCVGGGVDVEYRPRQTLIRTYLQGWRLLSPAMGMVQGATQFCSKAALEEIGGYDETAWIGEDVDFYWAMRKLAKRTRSSVSLIRNPRVLASSRCLDHWPVWKTLVWTNPLFIAPLRKRKLAWGGWYSRPVR